MFRIFGDGEPPAQFDWIHLFNGSLTATRPGNTTNSRFQKVQNFDEIHFFFKIQNHLISINLQLTRCPWTSRRKRPHHPRPLDFRLPPDYSAKWAATCARRTTVGSTWPDRRTPSTLSTTDDWPVNWTAASPLATCRSLRIRRNFFQKFFRLKTNGCGHFSLNGTRNLRSGIPRRKTSAAGSGGAHAH
jgi:hypothetical protein